MKMNLLPIRANTNNEISLLKSEHEKAQKESKDLNDKLTRQIGIFQSEICNLKNQNNSLQEKIVVQIDQLDNKLKIEQEYSAKMESLQKKNENLENNVQHFWNESYYSRLLLWASSNTINEEIDQDALSNILKSTKWYPFANYSLHIDGRNSHSYANFLPYILPKIKELRINYIKPLDGGMLAFLKNSIKKPIMNFCFNWGGRTQNGDYYANGLINALENVEQKIYISNLTLSQPNTEDIMRAGNKAKVIVFRNGKFSSFSDFDFGGKVYNAEYLGFENGGNSKNGCWRQNPKMFERLIRSLSNSSLIDTVKYIDIKGCDIAEGYARNILDIYDMDEVEFIDSKMTPY